MPDTFRVVYDPMSGHSHNVATATRLDFQAGSRDDVRMTVVGGGAKVLSRSQIIEVVPDNTMRDDLGLGGGL